MYASGLGVQLAWHSQYSVRQPQRATLTYRAVLRHAVLNTLTTLLQECAGGCRQAAQRRAGVQAVERGVQVRCLLCCA